MTETLVEPIVKVDSQKDSDVRASTIPSKEEIRNEIKMRILDYLCEHISEIDVRIVEESEECDTVVYLEEESAPWAVEQAFENYAASRALVLSSATWWPRFMHNLGYLLPSTEKDEQLQLNAVHDVILLEDDQTVGAFEVFDIGKEELSAETLDTVYATMQIIDQFSGGLVTSHPMFERIVLINGLSIGEGSGVARDQNAHFLGYLDHTDGVVINISGILKRANEEGAPYRDTLSAVMVHEILGHLLERLLFSEDYFEQFFDYSEEKVQGDIYTSIHRRILPKNKTHVASQPVREYGYRNPSEDLATAVDGFITRVMGWDLEKVTSFRSNPDAYREEIVMKIMDIAAAKAREIGRNGVVGSAIAYAKDEAGNTVVRPAMRLSATTVTGSVYFQNIVEEACNNGIDNVRSTLRVKILPEIVI